MGRGYSVQEYREVVYRLRTARPDLALSTDLIVGFPGRERSGLREDRVAGRRAAVSHPLFAFAYSPRPGTAAPKLPDAVEPEIASRRLQVILETQEAIQRRLNETLVGSRLPVLVTGMGNADSTLAGRTACHRIVHFETDTSTTTRSLGEIHPVLIERANPHSLVGRAV